jgi:ubiquinone biosynthesis protein
MVQSLGKQLDKHFDIFSLLEPNVKRFIQDRHSPSALARKFPAAMAEFAELGVGLPQRLNRIIKSVERGELKVRSDVSGLEIHMEHLEKIVNRMILGIILAAAFLGITILVLTFSLR